MEALVFYLDKRDPVLGGEGLPHLPHATRPSGVVLAIFGLLMLLGASNFRRYYTGDFAVMDNCAISLMNLSGTSILLYGG